MRAKFGLDKLTLVLLDSHPSVSEKGLSSVYTDAVSVAKAAMRELLPRGLADFAYLPYSEDTVWSRNRGEAFATLVWQNGLAFHPLAVPKRQLNAVRLVEFLVPQVTALPYPCGVFAANDEMARAVVSACEKAGLNVPNDIAVVGVDNDESICEMGCSRRLADLRFTEAMGHTILDEIHAVRIERVKELLRKPGQEVAAIPNLCGYGSLADLCRDFKKRTGQTLHGWRDR